LVEQSAEFAERLESFREASAGSGKRAGVTAAILRATAAGDVAQVARLKATHGDPASEPEFAAEQAKALGAE
jgi:hypothetical protein